MMNRKVRITVDLDLDQVDYLQKESEAQGISRNELVRRIVREEMERK